MSKQIIHTDAARRRRPLLASGRRQRRQDGLSVRSDRPGARHRRSGVRELRRPGPPGVRQHAGSHQAAGGTLDNVVKLTLFLTDLGKFAAANAIMAEIIPQPFPARSTIGVASLPKGAQFEVEAILVL